MADPAYRVQGRHDTIRTTFICRTRQDAADQFRVMQAAGYRALVVTGPDGVELDTARLTGAEVERPAWRPAKVAT